LPGWDPPGRPVPQPDIPPQRPAPAPWPQPPVIPVPLPPEQSALTQELREGLLGRRIVLLTGHLDQPAATSAAAQVMLLDAEAVAPIQLHISCPDADLDAAIMLAETIDLLRVPVRAVAGGILGGPAIVVYASAGHRAAHRHTALQLREPRFQSAGNADQLAGRIAQHQHQLDYLYQRVADACGQPVEKIITDMQAGVLLTGDEAVRYGLVHELLTRSAPPAADPGDPPAG
jgi:ATP-dependent Clp protease protease subunit